MKKKVMPMLPAQCRMARAALNWNINDLATAAQLGPNAINRFENLGSIRVSTCERMRQALENEGVVFLPDDGNGAGLRLRHDARVILARRSKARKLIGHRTL